MMTGEQAYAQAVLMAGELEGRQRELLRVLCAAAAASLTARLRDGVTEEACRTELVMAASLYALADLTSVDESAGVQEFRAGDLTVKKGSMTGEAAARNLQRQAEQMMRPFLKDSFAFLGV